ncbi:DUF397 domain-containing protein [Kitasatospora sp. NPDC093558]|uniref:DUF397 domain-containing protein n=1 Tax=Kitasatospora sp. NPDC093558 TaxID=3155201 RepID=UPI00342AABC1
MTGSVWQKSSFSSSSDTCVEVRAIDGAVELRESDESGVLVRTTRRHLAPLLQAIKAGEYSRRDA